MALSRQCQLLKVTRSVVYEQSKRLLKKDDESELRLLQLLDEEYTMWTYRQSQEGTAIDETVRLGRHGSRTEYQ
jgi:hypothetical protein